MHLGLLDVLAMVVYAVILIGTARLNAARAGLRQGFHGGTAPGRLGLGWWPFGISLLVAAYSAEQIIGMAGAAYAFGIAVATYEWTATISILVVGKYLLPILHHNKLSSVPEFLHRRYGPKIQFMVGCLYLILIICVKLPVILWLSAVVVHCITGLNYFPSLLLIGLFAGNYALYVGLKQDAFGNLIHILLTILSGLIVVSYTLSLVAESGGLHHGLRILMQDLPEHFHMFLTPGDRGYMYAPGIGMLFGGMWVLHFAYWGANQGIFKRTVEDTDLHPAQHSLLITAIIKLFFPVLVVLPGIVALYLLPGMKQPDNAIPEILLLLPPGIMGFVFTSLMVACVSSMGSELSQLSTVMTNDVLNNDFLRIPKRKRLIITRVTTKVILVMTILLTDVMMHDTDLAYMYLQDMMGMVAPIILTLFIMGFFWKGANQNGAYCAIAGSLIFSVLVRFFLPGIPFIDRIGFAFLLALALLYAGARLFPCKNEITDVEIAGIDFSTSRFFNWTSIVIVLALLSLYVLMW